MAKKRDVVAGRKIVDAYRKAHSDLSLGGWHKGIPEAHTPLLEKMVGALDKLGFSSSEIEFSARKNEVIEKFWDSSEIMNMKELGFTSRENFMANATKDDVLILDGMWE